jgi:hypothetical protein
MTKRTTKNNSLSTINQQFFNFSVHQSSSIHISLIKLLEGIKSHENGLRMLVGHFLVNIVMIVTME